MAAATVSSHTPAHLITPDADLLNTLRDPRTPSTSSVVSRNDSVSDATSQPELNEEIANLSEKLVNAINHQTNLDDTLQHTRHELEIARQEIERLLAQTKDHEKKVSDGLLLPKETVERREFTLRNDFHAEKERQVQAIKADKERDIQRLSTEKDCEVQNIRTEAERQVQQINMEKERFSVEKEREVRLIREEKERVVQSEQDLRLQAEKDKKVMEQELESLTSALFTQANTMVAEARKEKEVADKRIDQLKKQLRDTEILLESQQEQLVDLKSVLEKMSLEEEDKESVTRASTNPPSSPMAPQHERMNKVFESTHFSAENTEDVTPDHPLHFSHLIQPVLRTDHRAFEDFHSVLKAAKAASPPPSRVPSGSYGSLNVMSYGSNAMQLSQVPSPLTSPHLRNGHGSPRASIGTPPLPLLRDTKMFKRALAEDIEPTLRLDIAPGVSWMVRRVVLNSLIDGSLVVEPMPPPPVKFRGPVNPCALCGENRIEDLYHRRHRFRISEDRERKAFPLCDPCLGRLRSCGDLLSFLRMVSNGHWKADSEDEVKQAWEEFVRLRERMFWHRISGGVVPVAGAPHSPHSPQQTATASSPPPLPPREHRVPPPLPPRENSASEIDEKGGVRSLEDPFRRYDAEPTNGLAPANNDQATQEVSRGANEEVGRERPGFERNDSVPVAVPGSFT
jgi:Rab guanine nucleotide exchange factor SEC2